MNKEDKNIIGAEYRPYDNSYCIEIKTHTKAYIALYRTEDESDAAFTVVSIPYEEVMHTPRGTKTYTFVNVESNKTSKIYRTLYNENNIIKDMNKEVEYPIGMKYVPYDNSWCINIKTFENAFITPGYCYTEGESGATFTIVSKPYEEEIPDYAIRRTFVNVESNKTKNIYKVLYRESAIIKTSMEKQIKITVPEGMEIDEENSTFECIKFRPIEKRWRDDETATIVGYKINPISEICLISSEMGYSNSKVNYYLFTTKKQAKSALAMARISQIMANDKRFGGVVTDEEWNNNFIAKYVIVRNGNNIHASTFTISYEFLAFHTSEQRDLFLKENEDLVKDYLMIDC
jgi:hypothetical protein